MQTNPAVEQNLKQS